MDEVIEHGIRALEANRSARTPPGVQVLSDLIRKKAVSPEQWQRIAQAGAQVEFAMPEFAEVGSSYPVRFDFDNRLTTFYVYLDTLQYDDLPPRQFADLRLLEDNLRGFPNVEFETTGQHELRWQIRREHKRWNAAASRHELTMPSLVTTHSVRIDVLEQDEYEARLASVLSQALEFVQVQTDEPRGLQVDFRVTHRLPVPVEIEVLAERGAPAVALGVKQIKPGSAGVFSVFCPFPGIQTDSLDFTLRLYKFNRLSEKKGPALPDREFRFANRKVQRPTAGRSPARNAGPP